MFIWLQVKKKTVQKCPNEVITSETCRWQERESELIHYFIKCEAVKFKLVSFASFFSHAISLSATNQCEAPNKLETISFIKWLFECDRISPINEVCVCARTPMHTVGFSIIDNYSKCAQCNIIAPLAYISDSDYI